MNANEVIFDVLERAEGGYEARAPGADPVGLADASTTKQKHVYIEVV